MNSKIIIKNMAELMMLRKISIFIFMLFVTCSQYSQQDINDTTNIKTYFNPLDIVVTAERVNLMLKESPMAVSLVDNDFLQTMPRGISVDEPLKLVPGVKVDNQANGMRVHLSMRGQGILTERGIRGIKILFDGIPVNDPTGFAPDFFDIDFNNVQSMEILRGPAASLYGGSASGGIINITTKVSPNESLSGEASTTIGSNNFWKLNSQFGGSTDKINYRVFLSRTLGDGYRQHTHFWGNNVYGKITYTPTKYLQLTPIFAWTDVYHENPEGINLSYYKKDPKLPNDDAIPFNEYLQTNRVTNALRGLIILSEGHEINFNGYFKRTLFTEANNHTFNHRTILTPGTSLQYNFSYGKPTDKFRNRISIGTDLQWQNVEEYRVDNLHSLEGDTVRSKEEFKQSGVGLFVIDNIELFEDWSVMFSVRYDKIHNELEDKLKSPYDLSGNEDFSKATGRVGVTYSPYNALNLFINWGQGFLPPATEELAQNPDQFGGFNTHLTYSTSNCIDVGARGNLLQYLYYDVTVFYLNTENDFDRYRITNPLRTQETFYRNIGASKRFGVEVYGKYSATKKIRLQLAYTYSNFKYTISNPIRIMMDDASIVKYIKDGKFLPNSPQHQLNVDLQYNPIPILSFGISTESFSKSYIDGANIESEAVDGYTLINLRAAIQFDCRFLNGEINLNVRNISDKKYVAFSEPDPGGNAYQPGAGREIFGGIKIIL